MNSMWNDKKTYLMSVVKYRSDWDCSADEHICQNGGGAHRCQNIISPPLSPPDLSIVRSRAAVRALLIALVIVSESRLSDNSPERFLPHPLSLPLIVAQMHNPTHSPILNNTYWSRLLFHVTNSSVLLFIHMGQFLQDEENGRFVTFFKEERSCGQTW